MTEPVSSAPRRRRLWPRGLSGKLLVITVLVIMATEIFIFVPSVSNYRLTWLSRHFNTGEAVSLTLERLPPEAVPTELPAQLLELIQAEAIVIRRDDVSQVLASKEMPSEIDRHVLVEPPGRKAAMRSITEAMDTLINGGDRTIRVYGPMQQRSGQLELVMRDKPLRDAMLGYAGNVMLISFAISLLAGLVVFFVLRWLFIRPMRRISKAITAFADEPENAAHIIEPSGREDEIGVAEEQLSAMQKQLRDTFTQQRHLADLGLAVSKINHDMRNILASASLFSDRLTTLEDPTVRRLAPRLVRSIDRAADYTRHVLEYGKAGEAVPVKTLLRPHRLCEDVAEILALDGEGEGTVEWINAIPENMEIAADPDQLFRVILNLSRNAVQAMENADEAAVRRLTVEAQHEDDGARISIHDTGPGIPDEIADHLFTAFKSTGRNGGTGLGLAIAAELVRAHGGTIELVRDGRPGARFDITLPNGTH